MGEELAFGDLSHSAGTSCIGNPEAEGKLKARRRSFELNLTN
jgi:hypothetical protein